MGIIKLIKNVILLCAIAVFGYIFRAQISDTYTRIHEKYFPCQTVIAYSIGTFDTRFGISQDEFLQDISSAGKLWESGAGKTLFRYDPKGSFKISLMYDSRQDSTIKVEQLNESVQGDQTAYKSIRSTYDNLQSQYAQKKAEYDSLLADFKTAQAKYEAEVAYWNNRGKVTQAVYNKLQAERDSLDTQLQGIRTEESGLNTLADNVNSVVTELNGVARTLNEKVSQYGSVDKTQGEAFTAGEYVDSPEGREIRVYQYDSQQKLVHLLAHELGHAVGLDHVADPDAIMYKMNEGSQNELAPDDISALKQYCKIK